MSDVISDMQFGKTGWLLHFIGEIFYTVYCEGNCQQQVSLEQLLTTKPKNNRTEK